MNKEIILKSINDAIEKCGRGNTPKQSSGLIDEPPRYESDTPIPDNKLLNQIADEMAERYGLEVSINSKGKREIGQTKFSLWDEEHQTLINLNKMVKHPEFIDFTNNEEYEGKEEFNFKHNKYTLDTILKEYSLLDDSVKDNMGALTFDARQGDSYQSIYDGTYFNTVNLSSLLYGSREGDYTLKRILNHECGHAGEQKLTTEQMNVLAKAFKSTRKGGGVTFNPSSLTSDEMKIFNDFVDNQYVYRNQFSYSKEYTDAMGENNVHTASSYSASYGLSAKSWIEDYAETMGAVAYRNLEDKSGFKIRYNDGSIHGYDDFVSDHQATFQFCCDVADGKITHEDLHHPTSNFSFKN